MRVHLASVTALFIIAMSVHAYQGEAEDVEPNADYRQGAAAQFPAQSTPGIKQSNAAPGRQNAESQKADPKDWRRELLDRLVDPITLFTGLLVGVGLAQWRALRRQVDRMTASIEAMKAGTSVADQALVHARETTTKQLEELRRQYNLNRAVAQRQLRAYVFAAGGELWNVDPGVPTFGSSTEEKLAVERYAKNGPSLT